MKRWSKKVLVVNDSSPFLLLFRCVVQFSGRLLESDPLGNGYLGYVQEEYSNGDGSGLIEFKYTDYIMEEVL